MTLDTVADYVASARVLLQDKVEPYRYETEEIVQAINLGILEARRLRPDFFIKNPNTLPFYDAADSTPVEFPAPYRTALLYYIVGHAQLRDEEDTQDARASVLLNKFAAQLSVVPS